MYIESMYIESKWLKVWLTIIIFLQENIKPVKPLTDTISMHILYTCILYTSMENTCILLKIIKEYNGAFRERIYIFCKTCSYSCKGIANLQDFCIRL